MTRRKKTAASADVGPDLDPEDWGGFRSLEGIRGLLEELVKPVRDRDEIIRCLTQAALEMDVRLRELWFQSRALRLDLEKLQAGGRRRKGKP
jgi:hypothetical protein